MDFCVTCDCGGKVNINDWQLDRDGLFSHQEVDNVFFPQVDYPFSCTYVRIFECVMLGAVAIMDLNHHTNCMEMQLKILNRQNRSTILSRVCDNDDEDYFSIRKMICEFILYFRAYMNGIKWDLSALEVAIPEINKDVDALFNSLKRFFSTLRNIPDSILHYAVSNIGNKCKQPEFHLYHIHIELRWFFVTLVHSRTIWCQYQMHSVEELENSVEMVVNDLIYFALKVFERISLNSTVNFKQKTPYLCTCIRELWLMLQIIIDSLVERMKTKTFWGHVNSCIHKLLNTDQTQTIFWHRSGDSVLPDCKNPELFCIWIVYHLSLLYGYSNDGIYLQSNSSRIKSNYEQVEKILKMYVEKGGKDGERDELDVELKIIISLLHELIINWWQPHQSITAKVIGFLWDCFHKRLDQPFLLQTSGPWALSLEKKTTADILKQINNRIDGKIEHSKESNYGMFLYLIGTFLKKYSKVDSKYWTQIKGRVYSKFWKEKIAEFSESSLYNFISLFITLAVTEDIMICKMMLDLLPSTQELNNEYNKKCSLIWKGKLACLLLFNERRISFAPIINHFMDTINLISCRKDETSRSMMTNYVDVLNTILSSSEKIDLEEHNFIGGWIDRYLLECPRNRIGFLLEMLANIFEKCVILQVSCDNSDGAKKMLNALWNFVACRIRQFVFDPVLGDNCRIISKLAVMFTLEAVRDPITAKKYKHSTMSLFQHFAASVSVKDIRITQYYLTIILEDYQATQSLKKEIPNFDTILIQAWIKCSILGYNTYRETRILQNYILHLDDIKELISKNLQEFTNDNEPVITFIISFMERHNALKTNQEKLQYNAKCITYFKNLEKWVLIPITEETKDTDLAIWIYRCLGTLILCLSPMLYTKNQPSDMLRTLINKVLLVPENSPQSYIKQLGKEIFSMVLLGLEKLNVKSDIVLRAIIRDIFDQYLPILITKDNNGCNFKVCDSLLKFFKDAKCEYLRLILEMLMANFYNISSDNVMHKHANLITWLIKTLLKEKTYPKYITEHIIQICSPNIFGCYMRVSDHHPHKLHTIDFIKIVIKNTHYERDKSIREKFYTAVSAMVQKNLIPNAQLTFELIQSILTVEKSIIINLIRQIDTIILQAEQYRRPNVVSLRFMFNQLKKQLLNMNKNV